LRGKKDGCSLFGSVQVDENGGPVNDFVIPEEDQGIGKRHFIIKYNLQNKEYYIRDLGDGSGTFVKLDTVLVLKSGYIASFGDSHMLVQIVQD
jgi:hypothetical protein